MALPPIHLGTGFSGSFVLPSPQTIKKITLSHNDAAGDSVLALDVAGGTPIAKFPALGAGDVTSVVQIDTNWPVEKGRTLVASGGTFRIEFS